MNFFFGGTCISRKWQQPRKMHGNNVKIEYLFTMRKNGSGTFCEINTILRPHFSVKLIALII